MLFVVEAVQLFVRRERGDGRPGAVDGEALLDADPRVLEEAPAGASGGRRERGLRLPRRQRGVRLLWQQHLQLRALLSLRPLVSFAGGGATDGRRGSTGGAMSSGGATGTGGAVSTGGSTGTGGAIGHRRYARGRWDGGHAGDGRFAGDRRRREHGRRDGDRRRGRHGRRDGDRRQRGGPLQFVGGWSTSTTNSYGIQGADLHVRRRRRIGDLARLQHRGDLLRGTTTPTTKFCVSGTT